MDDDQKTVRRSLKFMKEVTGGGSVEITITKGRGRTPLRPGNVRSLMGWLSEQLHEERAASRS
jgi:hypothetical protein